MSKLIYIESSPRKKRSASIAISNVFLEEYRKTHPQDEIVVINVWEKELPPFDGEVIEAKYAIMHGQSYSAAQAKAWQDVEEIIREFKSGDKYVFSLPMWNYGIPYRLKHYIDVIVQPGYTFSFSPQEGYKGLVTGKKVALIYARGGAYGSESGLQQLDLQMSYMQTILQFIGFQSFTSIVIEPTLASDEVKQETMDRAKTLAKKAAAAF